jgi:hypothetical protein
VSRAALLSGGDQSSHHRCHLSLYNEVVLSALTQRETLKAKRVEIEQYVGTFDKDCRCANHANLMVATSHVKVDCKAARRI